jgi:hypothetical protein
LASRGAADFVYKILGETVYRHALLMRRSVSRRFGYREMEIARRESISVQMRRFYEAHSWVPPGVDLRRRFVVHDLPFDQLLVEINSFRPDVIRGYGSHLGAPSPARSAADSGPGLPRRAGPTRHRPGPLSRRRLVQVQRGHPRAGVRDLGCLGGAL